MGEAMVYEIDFIVSDKIDLAFFFFDAFCGFL